MEGIRAVNGVIAAYTMKHTDDAPKFWLASDSHSWKPGKMWVRLH